MINSIVHAIEKATCDWESAKLFDLSPSGCEFPEDAIGLSLTIHFHNYMIWHFEDRTRANNESLVVASKKGSNRHNQLRNDGIEKLDEMFVSMQKSVGPYNSETLGSVIDRISVFELKKTYVQGQKKRELITRQKDHLVSCAIELLDDMLAGRRQIKVLRQFKLYNSKDSNKFFEVT